DGTALVDSFAILDFLDDLVGRKNALIPDAGEARRDQMRICALAAGVADKTVSLIYERAVHGRETPDWVTRCTRQIGGALDALETSKTDLQSPWWFGDRLGHADIAVTCGLTLAVQALGFDLDAARWPNLVAHRETCEARPDFQDISQPFFAPPPKDQA
ncbi:MAG: glutathione S-transferase C-terminal domain-containing protein, partial [Caulobacterales bacterium]